MMPDMTFEDLPDDWPRRPLTDPHLVADVLDLVVTDASRANGALYVLLCDPDDRLLQPIAIDAPDPQSGGEERERILRTVLSVAEDGVPGGSALIAIARRDGLSATPDDELWARSALAARGRFRLLGVHVVTGVGSRPVPSPARVR